MTSESCRTNKNSFSPQVITANEFFQEKCSYHTEKSIASDERCQHDLPMQLDGFKCMVCITLWEEISVVVSSGFDRHLQQDKNPWCTQYSRDGSNSSRDSQWLEYKCTRKARRVWKAFASLKAGFSSGGQRSGVLPGQELPSYGQSPRAISAQRFALMTMPLEGNSPCLHQHPPSQQKKEALVCPKHAFEKMQKFKYTNNAATSTATAFSGGGGRSSIRIVSVFTNVKEQWSCSLLCWDILQPNVY